MQVSARARSWRRAGLAALVVFTFGVLIAPLAHNVGHRADHVHGEHFAAALNTLREQSGAHEHSHPHEHPHPHPHAPVHRHDEPFARLHDAADTPSGPAPHDADGGAPDDGRGSDPHHGEGSLAHFAAAVLAPPLFVLPPTGVAVELVPPLSVASAFDGRRALGPIQPRAPPT